MGKTPAAVARLAAASGKRVVAFCGSIVPDADAVNLFNRAVAVTPPGGLFEDAGDYLRQAARSFSRNSLHLPDNQSPAYPQGGFGRDAVPFAKLVDRSAVFDGQRPQCVAGTDSMYDALRSGQRLFVRLSVMGINAEIVLFEYQYGITYRSCSKSNTRSGSKALPM